MQTYYTPESALYVILFFKKVVKWCYDSIEKIQENGTYLSVAGENMLSNQIMQHKQVVLNGYMNAKQSASNDIDFWDKTLKKCKENFRDILKELE